VWGTSKNVPTLLFMLDAAASPSSERMLAMEAVSRMPPTKESAESIAKWLGDRTLGPVALQSLVVMGSASEEPAMNLLRRRTPARVLAALVLAHIGTEKSVTALEDFLRSEEDPEYRQLAKVALDEVRKRQSTGGKSQ
jgi:HEAT repeat protein